MKKFLRIALRSIVVILVLLLGFATIFIYKIKNGFPVSYETEVPTIHFPANQKAVLLFTKSTGFRHSSSIDTSKLVIADLAKKGNWFLYETDKGGVFNPAQLAKFSTVIFDNSTGEVINEEQKSALENYVQNGGSLIGIHGTGDNSHHWNWYVQNLLGSEFSHHALTKELQKTQVSLENQADSLIKVQIPAHWNHADEWYVFFENPRKKGFQIVCTINGDSIISSGKIPLLATDKDFGMGKDHPVAWYKSVGKGKTFYTSMGHDASCWKDEKFVKLIENAINWSMTKE